MMTAKKRTKQMQMGEISFDPLSEPRTIPDGWDVAAFYAPEQTNQDTYGMMRDFKNQSYIASIQNDNTPDTV